MTTEAPLRARVLVIALAAGTLPALLALPFDLPRFSAQDLLIPAIGALAWAALVRFWPDAAPRLGSRAGWAVAATLAILPAAFAAARFGVPVSNDEQAYLLQAEIFAEGRLAEPLPPSPHIFRWRQVIEDQQRGLRYAKYAPGTSLSLVPAVAIGWPSLAPLLAGLLDLLLVAAIARRLGLDAPWRAALLLAASPFFLLVQTSYQSEVFTLPAALAGYYSLLRAREAGHARNAAAWAAGVGAASGWIFLARPLTGVLFAAAAGVGLLLSGRRAAALAAATAAGLPFLAAALAANAFYSGDPFRTAYNLYAETRGPWIDALTRTQPVDVYGNGDFFPNFLDRASRWSAAFCGVVGGVALGFWGLFRLRARDGGAAALFAILAPAAYSFHWYSGHWAYLGPLYCYESLGFLVLGALAVLASFGGRTRAAFLVAAAVAGPLLAAWRLPPVIDEVDLRDAPQRAVAAGAPPGAVILLPSPSAQLDTIKVWTPTRPPFGPLDRVIVRTLPGYDLAADLAAAGLSGRPMLLFVPEGVTGGRLEPAGFVP